MELSPLQVHGVEWLEETGRRYLADPPGFGKTRQLLAAVGGVPTLVVCPATIRDAEVWPSEAAKIGWDGTLKVISYHQLAQGKKAFDPRDYGALIFDEAHWLKNRKVSWGLDGVRASKIIPTVYMGSGTPTPNNASELWGQLRMVRDIPAFWNWADGNTRDGASGWFHISSKKDKSGRVLTEYAIDGQLQACVDANCINGRTQRDGTIGPVTDDDCEHWAMFRKLEQEQWMLARPESLLDLPPMSGADTPMLTPMKPEQKKLYATLKKDFLASIPSEGIDLESISDSQKFIHLWQLSTGVSCVGAGDQDLDDKHSGKLALVAELLSDRSSPTLMGCYFRNTAQSLVRVCKRLNKSYVTFGASTTAKGRKEAVRAFQEGAVDVMIGSIPVVGEGLTLTAADGVGLVERMWTPDKNTQLIRRVQRRGQQRSVGVRQFVTPKSVDAGQWEVLKDKTARINRVDVAQLLDGELEYIGGRVDSAS